MHYTSLIPFVERFQRLLHLDRESDDALSKQVGFAARQFCKYTQRQDEFLGFKPSRVGAACILLAINLSKSEVAPSIGLKRLMKFEDDVKKFK